MRVIHLAIKDIKQILRDWRSALFLVVMPILFTMFFGVIFSAVFSSEAENDPRLPVGWINSDTSGQISAGLQALLEGSEVVRPVALDGEQVERAAKLVADGKVAAVVNVPAGYSQALAADRAMSLGVIVDQAAVGGRTVVTALDAVVARLMGAVESAHISADAYQERAGFVDNTARQAYFEEAFQTALAGWSDPPLSVRVELATGAAGVVKESLKINGFTQSSAGMIVQFAIFGLINSGMILVLERKQGALQRLMTTPIRRAEVIAGHILAMFLVVLLQETLLVALGQFAFGVDYLRQPFGTLLMMAALALWAASLGLLIGAVSRREDQVIVLCLIAMFVFSTLGGAWFPLEVTGKTFSSIGHLMPTAWAMDGFQNIVLRGLGFGSTLLPAGLLLAYTLAFFGIAIWRFKFE